MTGEAETRTPFIGRGEAAASVRARFEEARKGTGGVTLLVGDTGVGKSTLVAELLQEIREHGVRVLIGRPPASDDPPPYSLLHSAIASARDDPTLRADADPPIAGNLFMISFALPLSDVEFPTPVGIESRLLQMLGASGDGGKVSQHQVLSGIAERFLEFTRHGPTVLLLEDLDRADPSSLAAVEFFAAELSDRPLWILATSQPFGSLSGSGQARLESFEKATRARQILLPPMTSAEALEFLRASDPARDLSPEEVERRYSETGGNPLLLQQLDRRSARDLSVPGAREPQRPPLDAPTQRTLEIAAVLGRQFTFALLVRVSDEGEERLAEHVERLVSQGLLFERPGELMEFPVDRFREEAYQRLPELGRRVFHRSAGEALEEMGSADPARCYALARHFYLGRDGRKSVRYNRIAAEAADRALAPDVAREHLVHALESLRELGPEERSAEWELVLELARLDFDLGRLQDSEKGLREFLERANDADALAPAVRGTLEVCLAQALIAQGDLTAAAALAEQVLGAAGPDDPVLVRIGAHHQLGQALYYEGHYPEALAHHSEAFLLASGAGHERVRAHAQLWRAGVWAMMGQMETAIAEAREVAIALDGLASVRESGQGHLFLGNMLADSKSPAHREEALAELDRAARFAEQAQDPRRVGWACYHAAELLRSADRFPEAREKVERACAILGRIGDRTGHCMSLKVRGQVA
ncbi:MAG: AAA family ATPase, partial [Thermoplasmata archaeon]|nr:AAA family ATPase [Thermoplasmata archaeon]